MGEAFSQTLRGVRGNGCCYAQSTGDMVRVPLTLLATVVGGLAWTPVASQTPSWSPVVRALPSRQTEQATQRVETASTPLVANSVPKVFTLSALEALAREHHPSLAIAAARLTASQSGRAECTPPGLASSPGPTSRSERVG